MVDKAEEVMLEMFPRYVDRYKRPFTWMNNYDTKEKIVIFGDSYAHSHGGIGAFPDKKAEDDYNNKSWYGWLHHRTQKQIWNYGYGGTSLLYSKQNFFNYLDSDDYNKKDSIVFITTSYTRLPMFPNELQVDPKYQTDVFSYLYHNFKTEKHKHKLKNQPSYKLYDSIKKELKWYSYTMTREDFINELRMLQVFLNSLPNKTLLLPAFKYPNADKFLDIKDFGLSDVSENEKIHEKLFKTTAHPRTMGVDPRYQHMSETNNKRLSVKIENYFKNKDPSIFSLRGFERE